MSDRQKLHIAIDPMRTELEDIKKRQVNRKNSGASEVTNEMLWQMLYDIIENQARMENKIEAITNRLGI